MIPSIPFFQTKHSLSEDEEGSQEEEDHEEDPEENSKKGEHFTYVENLEKEPKGLEDENGELVMKRDEPKDGVTLWKGDGVVGCVGASVRLMSQLVGCEDTRSSGHYYSVSILIVLFIFLISGQISLAIYYDPIEMK